MLPDLPPLVLTVIAVAVGYDFVNGVHDSSNAIATLVATKALSPRRAVLWAGFFNFAALFVFGTGVAGTVGHGLVALAAVTPAVILAGLMGAISWGLLTWRLGLPTSMSHALLGSYAGAAMAHSALTHGWAAAGAPILTTGWALTLGFIVVAPGLGFALAQLFMHSLLALQRRFPRQFPKGHRSSKLYPRLQMVSSALLSLMHGSNDAQKTAGIITAAIFAGSGATHFAVPFWVLVMSYTTMGLGTLIGGWRIVRTLGHDLTRLQPRGGFCAETGAALSVLLATLLTLPVSTTHVTTGAIIGAGSARNPHAVRWTLARRIAIGWVITIPVAAVLGAGAMTAAAALKIL